MPVFIPLIIGFLIEVTASIVGRALVALGLSVVAYKGMSASLDWLKSSAVSSLVGLPPDLIGIISYMKVGECISIIFSAILARLLISGLQADTVKRWVLK